LLAARQTERVVVQSVADLLPQRRLLERPLHDFVLLLVVGAAQ